MKSLKQLSATSAESVNKSDQLAVCLRDRIVDLVREAQDFGLTINEAERQIQDHKGHSVSPRFCELVRRSALVRVPVGYGLPTRRFPKGVQRYITRYDEETKRNVHVYWVPEFAPAAPGNTPASSERSS